MCCLFVAGECRVAVTGATTEHKYTTVRETQVKNVILPTALNPIFSNSALVAVLSCFLQLK
jgi:hypothetical protein